MKLLLDQNLSHRLAVRLAAEFPGSEHVRNVSLAKGSDPAIWSFAARHAFAIASNDVDFEHRALLYGHPPKVIWIRLGNCSTAAVETALRDNLQAILAFNAHAGAAVLVVS